MISLILPYWERQEAANKAFELLSRHYRDLDLEIVVVDDGNAIPFVIPPTPLKVKIITLPLKTVPKCPATAWNAGVMAASGDIIVLSCIEILHTSPVLGEMAARLESIGKNGYVLASAWCPEDGGWHCHSSIKTPRNPLGTGIAFCGMMYKEMFEKAGGFGEEYREGAGYEDNDFINRMLVAGANFNICDDLVVTHPKSGASISWPAGSFERNRALYYGKWPEELSNTPLNFVCVNWGDYCGRGKDYVNKLFDGITRFLPVDTRFRFICFSDSLDKAGFRNGIEFRPLPEGVNGWWNKLYLFKEGLFKEGERVIFFDLDTIITNSLEDIIKYNGNFATLRDFLQSNRLAPGVILWKAGFGKGIWDSYKNAGYPTDLPLGDLSWINKHFDENSLKVDIVQDLFPDKFVSYKVHAQSGIPEKAAVVCFHGFPRPHEAGGWVDNVWEKGQVEFKSLVVPNTTIEVAANNIKSACARDLPWLGISVDILDTDIVIIGGAPSLKYKLEEIKARESNGQFILATNGTYDYLVENGIMPDGHIIIDARRENVAFIKNAHHDVNYYIASQCHPEVFDRLHGHYITLIHLNRIGTADIIPPTDKPINLLSGGSTVGMIAISLAHCLGFRNFHLYGMDSSYSEDSHHAYEQKLNNNDSVLEVEVGGRQFKAAPWMIQQANEFQQLATILANEGCTITVAGDGLLPHIARIMANQ